MSSLAAKRRRRQTFVAVIVGLALFVIDVFAFNGQDFPYLVAALTSVLALTKWLLAWTPLSIGARALLIVLAAVPWAIVAADPFPQFHGVSIATTAWLGIVLLVLRRIDGRASRGR